MLRLVNTVALLTMAGFAAVQYGQPDWPLWVFYYCVPAFWAFMAAFRRRVFTSVRWLGWLWACVAAWGALVLYHWPRTPNWWLESVWLSKETARSGPGLMIAFAVLALALLSAYRRR